jgi:hypothetical protein
VRGGASLCIDHGSTSCASLRWATLVIQPYAVVPNAILPYTVVPNAVVPYTILPRSSYPMLGYFMLSNTSLLNNTMPAYAMVT